MDKWYAGFSLVGRDWQVFQSNSNPDKVLAESGYDAISKGYETREALVADWGGLAKE